MDSFGFIMSAIVYWKILQLGIEFQAAGFFSLTILKTHLHCLLTYIISHEKSAVILIFAHLYIMCTSFSGCFKNILFITGFIEFNFHLPWCSFFFFVCVWDSWSFLNLRVYSFLQIWKYFFKCFSVLSYPYSGTPITHKLGCLKLFHSSMMLCSLISPVIFLCFILDGFDCYIFKVINI